MNDEKEVEKLAENLCNKFFNHAEECICSISFMENAISEAITTHGKACREDEWKQIEQYASDGDVIEGLRREVTSLKKEMQQVNQNAYQREESLKKRLQLMGEKVKELQNARRN